MMSSPLNMAQLFPKRRVARSSSAADLNVELGKEMLRHIILLGMISALAGCVGTPPSRTSASRLVVPARQLPDGYGQPGWSPTEAQITSCETALAHAVAAKKHDLRSYHLILGGVIRDGRHHIVGLARVDGSYSPEPPNEDKIILLPFGGGDDFFRLDYDADQEKLVLLAFNAPL